MNGRRGRASARAGWLNGAGWLLLALSVVPLSLAQQPGSDAGGAGQVDSAGKPDKAVLKQDKEVKKAARKKADNKPIAPGAIHNPVLWRDPGNIGEKNMLLGYGGEDHQPKPPFRFESEDHSGTNPKFDARDANDKKWRVKLGQEARPEVTASRLLWAMGYFVEEDYLLPQTDVAGLHLDRGQNLVHDGHITDARFARRAGGQDKIAVWRWKENPFGTTREFNGLRVMMALIDNWDLKDVNNAVFSDDKTGQQLFLVSDIGATFGSNGEHQKHTDDKGNARSFAKSIFILKKEKTTVSFGTPHPPYGFLMHTFLFTEYFRRIPMDWIGKDIPRTDAHWIGTQLGQLSHQQLVDAFRAGDFTPEETELYVRTVEHRIEELKAL